MRAPPWPNGLRRHPDCGMDQDARVHRGGALMGLTLALALTPPCHGCCGARCRARWTGGSVCCSSCRPALYSLVTNNDAQKTMASWSGCYSPPKPRSSISQSRPPHHDAERHPLWVILSAHAAIALGTMAGRWRIVRTMASESPSSPRLAASAPRRAARSRCSSAALRHPRQHEHTITGAISGVGAAHRCRGALGVAGRSSGPGC